MSGSLFRVDLCTLLHSELSATGKYHDCCSWAGRDHPTFTNEGRLNEQMVNEGRLNCPSEIIYYFHL